MLMSTGSQSIRWDRTSYFSGFQNELQRVLSANSPSGCSAEQQPVTWDGLRPFDLAQGVLSIVEGRAQRGAPFAATREQLILKRALIIKRDSEEHFEGAQ